LLFELLLHLCDFQVVPLPSFVELLELSIKHVFLLFLVGLQLLQTFKLFELLV
jgi:hypothetical protein